MQRTLFTLVMLGVLSCSSLWAQPISPADVKQNMQRVADWQIEHFRDAYSRKKPHHIAHWTNGALYVGMMKWAAMAGDEKYYEWMKSIGKQQEWKLHKRQYHADDHTIGQMYCGLFRKYKDSTMLEPTIKQFDFIRYHPSQSMLNWNTLFHQDRWDWCDALFMSPPVWAQLYQITGKQAYLDFMVAEYKATTDFLFDKTVLEGGLELDPLFKHFNMVRLTSAHDLDLNLFPVDDYQDLDVSWWGWFFSPEGAIYSVYGGKDID